MPYSLYEGKQWAAYQLREIDPEPKTVLDVGAGSGTWGSLIRQELSGAELEAIEVWEPYIEQFGLRDIYDRITIADVRELLVFDYDLVIFGDVLEHMVRQDAHDVLDRAAATAKSMIISVPIVHMEQGAVGGNEYERHLYHWGYHQMYEVLLGLRDTSELLGFQGDTLGAWLWRAER